MASGWTRKREALVLLGGCSLRWAYRVNSIRRTKSPNSPNGPIWVRTVRIGYRAYADQQDSLTVNRCREDLGLFLHGRGWVLMLQRIMPQRNAAVVVEDVARAFEPLFLF